MCRLAICVTALLAASVVPALAQQQNPPPYPPPAYPPPAYPPPAYQAPTSQPPAYQPPAYPAPAYPPPSSVPPAAYQPPADYGPSGARPGNPIGTGSSEPHGNRASNISPYDTRSTIAPNLPSPPLGPNATPRDYLMAARNSLAAGRTGEAQQSLEMAQTRLLDTSVPAFQTSAPIRSPAIDAIARALQALGAHDRAGAMQSIDQAIPLASASAQ